MLNLRTTHFQKNTRFLVRTSFFGVCCICISLFASIALLPAQTNNPSNNPPFYWGWRGVGGSLDFIRTDNWLKVTTLPQNPRYVWIAGANRRIAYSSDSGLTWSRSTVPMTSRSRGDDVVSISCVDSLVGYASGSVGVFQTVNGGILWTDVTPQQTSQFPFAGCHFISRDTGVVVGVGAGCSQTQYFYRTTDGGATWTSSTTGGFAAQVNDVRLLSSRGLGYAVGSGYLWRTLDGGVSWSVFTRTDAPNSLPGSTLHRTFQTKGASFLVPFAGTDCAGVGQRGGARFSSDSGKTWREFNVDSPCYGAALLNDSTGWVCGENSTTIFTQDYGRTWVNLNCGIVPGTIINDIRFVNDSTGWITPFPRSNLAGESTLFRFMPPSQRFFQIVVTNSAAFNRQSNVIKTNRQVEFCPGDAVVLSVPDGYAWNGYPPIRWSNGVTFLTRIIVSTNGTYSVSFEVPGCGVFRDTVRLFFEPEASIVTEGPTRLCEGESVKLSVRNPQQNLRYEWSNGQTVIAIGTSITVSQTGTYRLTARREGSTSVCVANSSNSTERVVVFPRPNTTITALGKLDLCLGDTAVLQAPSGLVQYRWFRERDILVGRSSRLITTTAGTYSVQVVDTSGCLWTSNTLTVSTFPYRQQLVFSPARTVLTLDTLGLTGLTCATVLLRNQDLLRPASIRNIVLQGNVEFSLPQSQLPLLIPPNTARPLQLCFSPRNLGERQDTLLLEDICGTQTIRLWGVGVPNDLFIGTSRCRTDITLRSIGANGIRTTNTSLLVSAPIPNPAHDETAVVIERQMQTATDENLIVLRCLLFDIFGRLIETGLYTKNDIKVGMDSNMIEQGEFRFTTAALSSGMYTIVLCSPDGNKSFPIVVRH